MKKKPSWLRLYDFLTIAGPGLAILGLNIYGLSVGFAGEHATQAAILMAVVGLTFIAVWIKVVLDRRRWLSEFRWYATYGFMVHDDHGKYKLPDKVLFEAAIWRTITAWAPYYRCDDLQKGSDVFWVFFKKDLDENTKNLAKMKVEGLTIARSHVMQVDYDAPDQPLERTAFEHELGHIIMGYGSKGWDLETHHEFAKKHGLR